MKIGHNQHGSQTDGRSRILNTKNHSNSTNNNTDGNKNTPLPNHKNNFLFDVIMPNIYDLQNIKIIQKHQTNQPKSPSSNNKVINIKKSKIQKKIESIVKKNTQQQDKKNSVSSTPKLKKYTKQNIKKVSKFAEQEKYRKYLMETEIPIQKMKMLGNYSKMRDSHEEHFGEQQYSPQFNRSNFINSNDPSSSPTHKQNNNSKTFSNSPPQQSPFKIQFDQAIGQMRKMQQQSFEPFKQKVTKIIQKTISMGNNGPVNSMLEKVNFYLTAMSSPKNNARYRNIIVNAQERDRKIQSYCEQIEKGLLLKTKLKKNKACSSGIERGLKSQMKQYRSSSALSKVRPQTAKNPTSTISNSSFLRTSHSNRKLSPATRTLSSSRTMLNRYNISSAQFNTNRKSLQSNLQQKQRFSSLLQQIESTCWQSQINKNMLERKMNQMNQEWKIDSEGRRVYENRRMDMNQETLILIKRQREKADEVDNIEKYLIEP